MTTEPKQPTKPKSRHYFSRTFGRLNRTLVLWPSLELTAVETDRKFENSKSIGCVFALKFLCWRAMLCWTRLTPRPWTESAYWNKHPDELFEAKARQKAEIEAMEAAKNRRDKKAVDRIAQSVLAKIGKES